MEDIKVEEKAVESEAVVFEKEAANAQEKTLL